MSGAFQALKQTDLEFMNASSSDLPEISNVLCHILGYFKKEVSKDHKKNMIKLIRNYPQQAIKLFKKWTSV